MGYRCKILLSLFAGIAYVWPYNCVAASVAGTHDGVTKWTKNDGVITVVGNVQFLEGSTLIIDAGTQIEMSDDASLASAGIVLINGTENYPVRFSGGTLEIDGTISAAYTVFGGMRDVSFYGADVRMQSVSNVSGTPLSMYHSRAQIEESVFTADTNDALGLYEWSEALISSSTFIGANDSAGLAIYNSFADVRDTHFCANDGNVSLAVYAARRNVFEHAGALVRGTAFCDSAFVYVDDRYQPEQVDIRDNWWGQGLEPHIVGSALVTPWLQADPFSKKHKTILFFLPGIEASRLYSTSTFLGVENQLWEPNRNADVNKLFFASSGLPFSEDRVYTRDIIDEVNSLGTFAGGSQNIYKSLIGQFNSLVIGGVLDAWYPLPYDWRYSARDAALNMLQYIHFVSDRADNIVFIAHSNGGLVLRHLMNLMQTVDDPLLAHVSKLYFIAVPHEGTPQAALSLLYGHSLALLGGLILKSSVAQHLAQTIPGAYGLLPTETLATLLSKQYKNHDFTFLGDSFLTSRPGVNATSEILERVRLEQQSIDVPLAVPALNIIGEGIRTVYGLDSFEVATCTRLSIERFYMKDACLPSKRVIIEPLTTLAGDGTVLSASARTLLGPRVEHIFFDMAGYNNQPFTIDRNHSDITEAAPVLSLLTNDLSGMVATIPFFATSSLDVGGQSGHALMVSVHSPVVIDVYDTGGRHTGRLPHPTNFETTDTVHYQTEIPGSVYWEIGESKYVLIPESSLADGTRFELRGVGVGLATLVFEYINGDETVWRRIIEDVPTVPALESSIEIGTSALGASSTINTLMATTTFPNGAIATSTLADLATSTDAAIVRYGPAAYCRNRQTGELEPGHAQR